MFSSRFNDLMEFLITYGKNMPFNLGEKFGSHEIVEECMVSNINLMLKWAVKLKISLFHAKEAILILILKFTPLDPAIRRIFAIQGLIIS